MSKVKKLDKNIIAITVNIRNVKNKEVFKKTPRAYS